MFMKSVLFKQFLYMLNLLDVNNKGLPLHHVCNLYLTSGQTNVMCGYVCYPYQISQNVAPAVH